MTVYDDTTIDNPSKSIEVVVSGVVSNTDLSMIAPATPTINRDNDSQHAGTAFDHASIGLPGSLLPHHQPPSEPDVKAVICDLDLSVVDINHEDESSIIIIQAQISANYQDFCPLTSKSSSILCHAFEPKSIQPTCCPLQTSLGNKMNHISGTCFIPSSFLHKGMEIYSSMKVQELPRNLASADKMASEIPIALPWEGTLSVKCDSFHEVR